MSENKRKRVEDDDFKTPMKSLKAGDEYMESTPKPNRPKSFIIPPSPFLKRLGVGTGVDVFLMDRPRTPSGVLKSPWAVKKLNKKLNKSQSSLKALEERLVYEGDILKSMDHENIVGYRDTARGADGSICLCMESGEKSLGQLIETRLDDHSSPFPPEIIHKVIHSVSKALTYLHETKKVLHGDIKGNNILVKGDFEQIKLCDFGVCLKLNDDLQGLANEDDMYVGTAAWSGIEALQDVGPLTDRADIYPLGCVIFEMLALNPPHLPPVLTGADDDYQIEKSFDEDAFEDALGSVPILPDVVYDKEYHPYIALMTVCCRAIPKSRPSAKEIVATLETLTNDASAN